MNILIDTGPIVAFLNKNDQYHRFVIEQMESFAAPFYTCEAVLTESFFLMSRISTGVEKLIELLETQHIQLQPVYNDHQAAIHQRIQTYSNIPMSLADACLVHMAENSKGASIFTLDSDFQVYRTSKGDLLNVVTPF